MQWVMCSNTCVQDSWQYWIRDFSNELGQMLPPDSMVEAAAAVAR
jgi:hypothetical protein